MLFATRYKLSRGEYGLVQIEMTGRCYASDVASVEAGVTSRFELVPIPMARGAVLKALDGTTPSTVYVTPTTVARTYRCVKIVGEVNPFAAVQPAGGTHSGRAILSYRIVYQQVGTP